MPVALEDRLEVEVLVAARHLEADAGRGTALEHQTPGGQDFVHEVGRSAIHHHDVDQI